MGQAAWIKLDWLIDWLIDILCFVFNLYILPAVSVIFFNLYILPAVSVIFMFCLAVR